MTKPSYEELRKLAQRVLDARASDNRSRADHIDAAEARFIDAVDAADILELLTELARVRGLLQRLSPIASGSGRCPAVPCFDSYDYEAERNRKGWVIIDRTEYDELKALADSETTVSPHAEVQQENRSAGCTAETKSVEYSSQNPNFPQSSLLVPSGAESADIGKLGTADENAYDESTDFCAELMASSLAPTRTPQLKAGSAETGGEKADHD